MARRYRQQGQPTQMDSLIKGAGLSMTATQTIMTHAANMPLEKREAILRRLHGILNKYMTLADGVLDTAIRNPGMAGRSFLSSMGNNILQIMVAYTTLDEVKQQQLQANMSGEDREKLHALLQTINEDKVKLAQVREQLMSELKALSDGGKPVEGGDAEIIEGVVVAVEEPVVVESVPVPSVDDREAAIFGANTASGN